MAAAQQEPLKNFNPTQPIDSPYVMTKMVLEYSQSECITAIRDYYEFLADMFMDPSFIITPAPSGWPCLNPPDLQVYNKELCLK